jgi:hypothetical protein
MGYRATLRRIAEEGFIMPLNRLALCVLAALPAVATMSATGQTLQDKISRDQTL